MAIYLLKINAALMLLYGFYRLTVSRDTFFSLRRFTLWLIYVVALIVPALNMEYWVRETPTMASMANIYADTFYPMIVVKAQTPSITWMDVLLFVYWAGVALLSIRFVWQLLTICRMAMTSKKREVEGVIVHVLKGEGSPFSFFHWIFVYPQTLEGRQLHEVLVHECTHADGLHSLDSIFSELFAMVCWFNPFAWLMKQEVRINLEYLADESVLSDGNARKSYQYHLLGLAYRKPIRSTEIANNFNLLPLKKRIKMMNKRRTSEIGKAKYLLFAPLAGALLMVSNIESVAREISEQVPEMAQIQEKAEQMLHSDVAVANSQANELVEVKPKVQEAAKTENVAVVDSSKTDKVYDVVENMPVFPGGNGELMTFLNNTIKYPKLAMEAGVQGRVIVSFVIGKDGSITGTKVANSVNPLLDEEALRVVGLMPKWEPGLQKGKPVAVKYTIPISFRLSGGEAKAVDKKDNKQKKFWDSGCAEMMPQFPGGNVEMMNFFKENLKYPEAAKKANAQGRVIVTFTVAKDGSIEDAKVARSVNPDLDAEALRVVNMMPKWTPVSRAGKAVAVKYAVPVAFALPTDKK